MNAPLAALPLVLILACSPPAGGPHAADGAERGPSSSAGSAAPPSAAPASKEEAAVREVIEHFGRRLKNVSLLGPRHVLLASIRREYGPYVTDELLRAWLADPAGAPGRLTSSPWPERIEIGSLQRDAAGRWGAAGAIVESSSGGGEARRLPARMELVRRAGGWRIASFSSEPAVTPRPPGETAAAEPSAADAAALIEAYYAAIDAKDYERAYRLWEDDGAASGSSLAEFRAGFAETAGVTVRIGRLGRVEPAAGSRWIAVPVDVVAKSTTGETERYEGHYVLRRSVVDGATPAQREWRIASATITRVA